MCYDIQTSLIALFINIVTSIYLYQSTNKQLQVIALFFLFVGFMQFWDAIFWTYDTSTTINIYSTKMAMIWNHLEPIVLALLIPMIMKTQLSVPSKLIVCVYTISIVIYSIYGWNTLKGTGQTNQTCGSLYWQWNNMKGSSIVYSLFLVCLVVLAYQFTGWIRVLCISLTLLSFFFSVYKYRISYSTGRFWCYFASFSSFFFIIGDKVFRK